MHVGGSNNNNSGMAGAAAASSPAAGDTMATSTTSSGGASEVQSMAASIYREFEVMIDKLGEDSVKNLMPLVITVLESLDNAYLDKEETSVDMEMLKEDNEQLITQYEREKQLRKAQDTKYLEIEDNLIGQMKESEAKIESLESITRMLELKAKNATDHANRLEERETDLKAEFDRLHERYNVLLRTHIDHMERTKYLMGSDKFEMMNSMPVPGQQMKAKMGGMTASVDASSIRGVSDLISAHMTQSTTMDVNLANHISNEVDYQEEFGLSSDLETSPREPVTPRESKPAAALPTKDQEEGTGPEGKMASAEYPQSDRTAIEVDDSLGADLTDAHSSSSMNEDYDGNQEKRPTSRQRMDSEDTQGMGREVENLIKENTELMDMKNALNIVKNDLIARVDELNSEQEILREEVRSHEMVRAKMSENMRELEAELRSLKQKMSDKETDGEEQEDVPISQRKRFTRYEMQRVLMERNKYKERLMELEETLRWSEHLRARKAAGQKQPKKQGGIWDFFSGLFGDAAAAGNLPSQQVRGRNSDPLSRKSYAKMTKSVDFLDSEGMSEKRAAERREQYKQVRERVRKAAQGRLEACGWSLAPEGPGVATPTVPVPVCCRPLLDQQPSLKVWCAAGIILHGGKGIDGSYLKDAVSSVFAAKKDTPSSSLDDVFCTPSSLMWVGSSNQGRSHIAILDANNPNNVVDAFHVCNSHLLAIGSVPGALETDVPMDEVAAKAFLRGGGHVKDAPAGLDVVELGCVEWAELRRLEDSEDGVETLCTANTQPSPQRTRDFSVSDSTIVAEAAEKVTSLRRGETIPEGVEAREASPSLQHSAFELEPDDSRKTKKKSLGEEEPSNRKVGRSALPPHIRDTMAKYDSLLEKSAVQDTVQPTVWLGSQNQYIYIHSAISEWRKCLRRIKMPDAVLSLLYVKGRVFAALANGTIAVFHRNKQGGWSDEGYHVVLIGRATNSVRSLAAVDGKVWAAYKNCIVIINPVTLEVEYSFAAHPRKDSQVRTMQWAEAGVWLSIRLDSTLRLFHARTHVHLQDVDIEPYITKMLGSSRLDFSYVRTTALLVCNRRLWIGTGTGVIISVPLSDTNEQKIETKGAVGPGGLVRVYSTPKEEHEKPSSADPSPADSSMVAVAADSASSPPSSSFVPYCNLTRAQFSFHGHKDSVKFFLAVPGEVTTELEEDEIHRRKLLVISGGDGYIDFRVCQLESEKLERKGEEESMADPAKAIRTRDMSHLIVWEIDAASTK